MPAEPGGITSKVIILAVLLLTVAFASSSETALFSLTRFQLRRIRDRYKHGFDRIRTLLARPSRLLVLVILITEIVNVTLNTIITEIVHTYSRSQDWLLTSLITMGVSVPLVLVIGEITPKMIALKISKLIAIFNSKPLIILYRLLYPLLWIIDTSISAVLSGLGIEAKDHLSKKLSAISEEDFVALMEEGHREGTVNQDERELITNVLEFDDSTIVEVMTPIQAAFCIPDNTKLDDVIGEIRNQKYSRVPIYHKNRKNISGIILVKNLLKLQNKPDLREMPVKELMTDAIYVRPEMHLSALFKKFKSSKSHIAICTDSHGEALGLVTMEDVLESIFGEIEDEHDVRPR